MLDWALKDGGETLPMPTKKANIAERARYIPVRFSFEERKLLRILEAGLNVCPYSDPDINCKPNVALKEKIRGVSAILSGIAVASSYSEGQDLLKNKDFAQFAPFFKKVFEIGRRHKIMNPDKMRTEYGKMMIILQDSISPQIQDALGFSLKSGIKTVYQFLRERNALDLLSDPDIHIATKEIIGGARPRWEVQNQKEKVLRSICRKYASRSINEDELKFCIYSITDNNNFLNANSLPIEKMINYLRQYFDPERIEEGYDLSISTGDGGARLSHDHRTQFKYVEQSLMLWKEIMDNMFMLWSLAEDDLLNENHQYQLKDTGQGCHRLQECPQVSRVMHAILAATKNQMGYWIGESTIHLGDHNVPNALVFIDKYTQVPRILVPIVTALEGIDQLAKQKNPLMYLEAAFGSAEQAKKAILVDFFRHGFDGSGADNFYDAGSCIDGRLTSAWNWCSQLEKKKYHPIFLLTGFMGFDGDFQK